MANEFIIKNGYFAQGNSNITGSLSVSGGITGSLLGTASLASTASYALTASYVIGGSGAAFPYTGSAQITGSLGVTGSLTVTGVITGSISGSVAGYVPNIATSSFITNSQTSSMSVATASYVLQAVSSSFATTSSFAQSVNMGNSASGSFGITIDGAGSTITTGVKGYITIPYAGTITGWQIIANATGSCVVDIWKASSGVIPTIANTIAGTEKPTLSSQQINTDLALTSWTTSVANNDVVAFNIDSASTVTRVNLTIFITKS